MLKAAGIFLIFAATAGLGHSKSMELALRERELGVFLQIIRYLKGAVRCTNASLGEAFGEIALRFQGRYREFLMETAKRLQDARGETFGEIYGDCVNLWFGNTAFSEKEKALIFSLGERLGYLDREMQLAQLAGFEAEIAGALEELRRELPQKKKLCQSLGILGGLFLGVLLW